MSKDQREIYSRRKKYDSGQKNSQYRTRSTITQRQDIRARSNEPSAILSVGTATPSGPRSKKRGEKFGEHEPTSQEIIEEAQRRGERRRQKLVEGSRPHLSVHKVAEKLGWTVGDVQDAIDARRLVHVQTETGDVKLPAWQVDGNDVVDGLKQVLEALPDYGWEADLIFFESEHFRLDEDTPAEALLKGKIDIVRQCAATQWRQGGA